jgi:RNA polymerase sigma-70 factor (ECF subfamily)
VTEADTVALARQGDHDAFRVLVERYQGRAYRLALRVLRDETLAQDAVQEAFLKLYRSIRNFEGRSSFYTWLYRLVLNVCLDMRRRDRSDRQVEWTDARDLEVGDASDAPTVGAVAPGPGLALERAELRKRLGEAIDTLPEEARTTLLLREVDGLSYAEIAEVLGIPKGTVMSRLHYARRRLQRWLVEVGGVEAPSPSRRSADEGVS